MLTQCVCLCGVWTREKLCCWVRKSSTLWVKQNTACSWDSLGEQPKSKQETRLSTDLRPVPDPTSISANESREMHAKVKCFGLRLLYEVRSIVNVFVTQVFLFNPLVSGVVLTLTIWPKNTKTLFQNIFCVIQVWNEMMVSK